MSLINNNLGLVGYECVNLPVHPSETVPPLSSAPTAYSAAQTYEDFMTRDLCAISAYKEGYDFIDRSDIEGPTWDGLGCTINDSDTLNPSYVWAPNGRYTSSSSPQYRAWIGCRRTL